MSSSAFATARRPWRRFPCGVYDKRLVLKVADDVDALVSLHSGDGILEFGLEMVVADVVNGSDILFQEFVNR